MDKQSDGEVGSGDEQTEDTVWTQGTDEEVLKKIERTSAKWKREDEVSKEEDSPREEAMYRLMLNRVTLRAGGDEQPLNPNQEKAMEAMQKHNYTFEKRLGAGAFAVVYKAGYKDKDGKEVTLACKVTDRAKLPSHFIKNFFPRELAMMSMLNHPHIVKVRGFQW